MDFHEISNIRRRNYSDSLGKRIIFLSQLEMLISNSVIWMRRNITKLRLVSAAIYTVQWNFPSLYSVPHLTDIELYCSHLIIFFLLRLLSSLFHHIFLFFYSVYTNSVIFSSLWRKTSVKYNRFLIHFIRFLMVVL